MVMWGDLVCSIGRGDFKFPNWFAPDVRRLLSKILDPNPKTRISIAKIMESSWFKRGLEKPTITQNEDEELAPLDALFVKKLF